MFKRKVLDNGLRLITIPLKNTQAATVLVLAGTGSKYEKKEISGISHFLEHLLFKGTKKRPTQIDIAGPLDSIGGMYNAFTSHEYTGYYAKVDSKHYELALDVISDVYLNSKLDNAEIEKERKVIKEEINMYQDNPPEYAQILWYKLLYGDQPAGWNLAGTKESLDNIKRDQLQDYLNNQYVSKNTVVVLAGNIPVNNLAEKYFSRIKNTSPFLKTDVFESQQKPSVLFHQKETDQTHFCFGARARGYSIFSDKKYAFEILASILGGMMSSRLFIKVREELGLAYYITTTASSDSDTGFLLTQAGVDNKRVEEAVKTILKEYKLMTEKLVPQKELKKAKENLIGKMALLLESSEAQASFYGSQELLERSILTEKQVQDKINRVRAVDILKIAKEVFRTENLNISLVGPFKDKEKLIKLLKI